MGTRFRRSRGSLTFVVLAIVVLVGLPGALKVAEARADSGPRPPADVIVVFSVGTDDAHRDAILREAGAEPLRHFKIISASSARAGDDQTRRRLAQHPNVVLVSANRSLTLGGKPGSGGGEVTPSGVARIGAPTAHLQATGLGVGVAVVDTGLDLSSSDLQIGVACFDAFGGTCQDLQGHGTRVGGIIGARANGSGVLGVAPDATLYAVRVFDAAGQGTDETVIAGLEWIGDNAVALGIHVVNLSFYRDATPADGNPAVGLRGAVAALYAQGLTVIAAAGDNLRHVSFEAPAGYPEVLAVAGTSARDGTKSSRCRTVSGILAKDTEAYATNDGAFLSGVGVTISAPGNDQMNLVTNCLVDPLGVATIAPGGVVSTLGGTSAAAAHVSGVAALMWEARHAIGGTLPPEEARCIIRVTADRIGIAPIVAPSSLGVFPTESPPEKEGIVWAPGAVSRAASTSACP